MGNYVAVFFVIALICGVYVLSRRMNGRKGDQGSGGGDFWSGGGDGDGGGDGGGGGGD